METGSQIYWDQVRTYQRTRYCGGCSWEFASFGFLLDWLEFRSRALCGLSKERSIYCYE